MCGICGILDTKEKVAKSSLHEMIKVMKHRGPDDDGTFVQGKVGLGHVRLSIIDLTDQAHQPMANDDETVWIVYNGEIYNYIEIRNELETKGFSFRSTGDTEVLLKAYEHWGDKCLSRLNGMFSFVIYDSKKKKLFGARDRFGIKPFYYYHDTNRFIFASEIKPILANGIEKKPDPTVIYDYLVYDVLEHNEHTFFEGIRKLMPGHYVKVDVKTARIEIRKWWELDTKIKDIGTKEAVEKFRDIFTDSVRLRLRSDVPVGSCLSGGLDSSSIVSKMVKLLGSPDNINTFSSVYSLDFPGNENKFIRAMVKRFGVRGFETEPSAKDIITDLERLVYHQEEPFNTLSPLAQWEVMKLANRNDMKVLLDGQGSDEMLAGYLFYYGFYFAYLLSRCRLTALSREKKAYKQLHTEKNPFRQMRYLFVPGFMKTRSKKKKATYLARDFLSRNSGSAHFQNMQRRWSLNRALKNSMMHGLVRLLRFEDKASMAFSIETRIPFLDHRLVEFVFSLPDSLKLRDGKTKYVLREAMKDSLPKAIYDRHDKVGFAAPEDIWLKDRKIMKYASDILTSKRTISRGYYDAGGVDTLLKRYKKGDSTLAKKIWALVNLELWFRLFMDRDAVSDRPLETITDIPVTE